MRYTVYLTRLTDPTDHQAIGIYSTRHEAERAASLATVDPACPSGYVGRVAIWGD